MSKVQQRQPRRLLASPDGCRCGRLPPVTSFSATDSPTARQTTVYVVRYPRLETRLSIEHFAVPEPLDRWCRRSGIREAIVGGFFLRPRGPALGELWIDGRRIETEPIPDQYQAARAAIHIEQGEIRIAARAELPARPAGHLLQAGPLLVRDGTPLRHLDDAEGFVAGAHQFDSDITAGRHPRAALAISDQELTALVCDGRRTGIDAGLTLTELADLIAGLGATTRSTSTAAARPHSSTAATCSTTPTPPRTAQAAAPARSRPPRSSNPQAQPHAARPRSDLGCAAQQRLHQRADETELAGPLHDEPARVADSSSVNSLTPAPRHGPGTGAHDRANPGHVSATSISWRHLNSPAA